MERQFTQKKSGMGSALGVPSEWEGPAALSSLPLQDNVLVSYVQASDLSRELESETSHTLAVIGYGRGNSLPIMSKSLAIEVHLPSLTQPPVVEVWKSSTPVLRDQGQDLRLAFTDDFVFGCFEANEHTENGFEELARDAYTRILEYCTWSGFSHLLRMWNYFPHMNAEQNGLERYQRFCIGRHQAFSTSYQEFSSILPAASAVGTQGGPFQVLFLAGRQPGRPLENPRQISAYKYPPIYGPKSPSFSRATLHRTSTGCRLLVAGTASIVGHATQHQGDPVKQTLETLSNIDAVLNRVRQESPQLWGAKCSEAPLKVFVRNREDLCGVREVLEGHEHGKGPILYVLGEMCRKELLVEIEGIWNLVFLHHEERQN